MLLRFSARSQLIRKMYDAVKKIVRILKYSRKQKTLLQQKMKRLFEKMSGLSEAQFQNRSKCGRTTIESKTC